MPHRYDANIDLSQANTSHTMVVELVGQARRVLDVGCATGALAAVLRDRGCAVSGIEVDTGAAELARPILDQLVLGRVEDVDLEATFGGGTFDAIVVADVLEHLVAPEETLRRLQALLAPGGAIVASIPNVAHGSVRLALLRGRFDYTDVGLLDRTHLRFFTRESAELLFENAGYAVTEIRRTVAGIFDTEIDVSPEDFSAEVIRTVLDGPESTTYQFVIRAVPGTPPGDEQERRAVEIQRLRILELERRVEATARELADAIGTRIAREGAVRWPRGTRQVGIWGYFDIGSPGDALRLLVHTYELSRRLPDTTLRPFAPFASGAAVPELAVAVEPLRAATADRVAELAASLDAIVVIGDLATDPFEIGRRYGDVAAPPEHPGLLFVRPQPWPRIRPLLVFSAIEASIRATRQAELPAIEAFAAADVISCIDPVLAAELRGADVDASLVPDPLLGLARAVPRDVLEPLRLATLASAQIAPHDRYVVIHGSARSQGSLPSMIAALRHLRASDPSIAVLSINLDRSAGEGDYSAAVFDQVDGTLAMPRPADAVGVAALLAGSQLVVSPSPWVHAVATSYGVRAIDPSNELDPQELVDEVERGRPVDGRVIRQIDDHFDRIASAIAEADSKPMPPAGSLYDDRLSAQASALDRRAAILEQVGAAVVERSRRLGDAEAEITRLRTLLDVEASGAEAAPMDLASRRGARHRGLERLRRLARRLRRTSDSLRARKLQ